MYCIITSLQNSKFKYYIYLYLFIYQMCNYEKCYGIKVRSTMGPSNREFDLVRGNMKIRQIWQRREVKTLRQTEQHTETSCGRQDHDEVQGSKEAYYGCYTETMKDLVDHLKESSFIIMQSTNATKKILALKRSL